MRRLSSSGVWRKILLPFTLVLWLAACYKWVPAEPPGHALREAAASGSAGTYRVHLTHGITIDGRPIGIAGDSVVLQAGKDSATVAMSDIGRAEKRQLKVAATILLTVGLVAAPYIAYGIALAIACSGQGQKCLS